MNELEQIITLGLKVFDGNQDRHLELRFDGAKKSNKGKVEATARLVDGALTPELLAAHFEGNASIGVSPVQADCTCAYGVLDVDMYDMDAKDVAAVEKAIKAPCAAFRTKSRGLHIYIFAERPVPARVMHEYLVALHKRLPKRIRAQTEIFPKQTQTKLRDGDKPTSVNLPMCGQKREPEFLINAVGQTVMPTDVTSVLTILEAIDQFCRIDAQTMIDVAQAQPVMDGSAQGYRVPSNPAGRNDLLMRIARSMQARGWDDADMDAEVRRLNREGAKSDNDIVASFMAEGALPDPEINTLLKTAQRLEKGTPVQTHYRNIEKFNERWSKITIRGVVEYVDKRAPEFTTFTKQMLFDETSDQNVRIGKSLVSMANIWLKDPDHARYKEVVCEPVDYDGPAYNVWKGFAVAPIDGDPAIFIDYIENVLCSGDKALAEWVTMWLADAVQRPTEPSPPSALALRGPQGGGKSFLQERILTPIFGDRYVQKVQESERLFSRFNRSIFGSTFIAAEESIFYGSEATASKLKSFISSPSWTYEEKFKATVQAKNVHRLIATTNGEQAVHLDRDDRRWTVIEVPQPFDMTTEDGKQHAYAFWEPYHAFMRGDGPDIVLRYLLDYSVDRQRLTFGHMTKAKALDKEQSDPVLQVLADIASNGVIPDNNDVDGVISSETLFREVRATGMAHKWTKEQVVQRATSLLPYVERSRRAKVLDRIAIRLDDSGLANARPLYRTRQRGLELGDLDDFRVAVSKWTLDDYADDKTAWHAWIPPLDDRVTGEPF